MAEYNGYPSWESWNVSLWINNTEPYYRFAREKVEKHGIVKGAKIIAQHFEGQRTPDGARYSERSIYLAVQDILE